MKKPKISGIERLRAKMLNPPFGIGKMHYTSLSESEVVKTFKSLSSDYRKHYALEIPRNAYEITEMGTHNKIICVGRYYVINKR